MRLATRPLHEHALTRRAWLGRRAAHWVIESTTGRFLLLVGLELLYYVSFSFTKWQPRPGQLSVPVSLLPIPSVVWYTGTWLVFGAAMGVLLLSRGPLTPAMTTVGVRRIAILAVVGAFAFEIVSRLMTVGFFGLERRVAPGWLGAGAVLILAGGGLLLWLVRRPPSTRVLMALLLLGGLAVRALWFVLIPSDPAHSDNMFVILGGLQRFLAGQTPYAYFDFGTHKNPMPYLPWTFLSYVPAYVARLDIRLTNDVISLVILFTLWATARVLPIRNETRESVMLALGVFYCLPLSVSLDQQTEFQLFNLAMVLTFTLIAVQRDRLAAAGYGVALGAMPVALYCAPPLLAFALRQRRPRDVLVLMALAAATALVPILAFLGWDAQAFLWAVSYVPRENYQALNTTGAATLNVVDYELPVRMAWHLWAGRQLVFVQLALLAGFGWLSWRYLRTVHGLIGLAVAS